MKVYHVERGVGVPALYKKGARVPQEVAFSLVKRYPGFKVMTAGEYGAYMALAQAAVLGDLYPLPTHRGTLAKIARATRPQWFRYQPKVLKALEDTLPTLLDRYYKEKENQRQRSERTKQSTKAWHDKLRELKVGPRQLALLKKGAESITPETVTVDSRVALANEELKKRRKAREQKGITSRAKSRILTEVSAQPLIIQPIKSEKLRATSYDHIARRQAKSLPKLKGVLLRE